jgi:hypothetical protein
VNSLAGPLTNLCGVLCVPDDVGEAWDGVDAGLLGELLALDLEEENRGSGTLRRRLGKKKRVSYIEKQKRIEKRGSGTLKEEKERIDDQGPRLLSRTV